MTLRDKVTLVILSILTLGIFPLIVFRRKNASPKENLSKKKSSIDVIKLIELLNGSENIIAVEYNSTKIKVFIKETKKIKLDAIKNFKGISGAFVSSKYITLIVGNTAKLISLEMQKHLI